MPRVTLIWVTQRYKIFCIKQIENHYFLSDEVRKGQALATDVVKVDVLADTLAVVYYKIKYESGNEEVSSNKMVRRDGQWKIRVRN